jgi:predicted outer membrane repeat protein
MKAYSSALFVLLSTAACFAQVDVTSEESRPSLRNRELVEARNLKGSGTGVIQAVNARTNKFLCTVFGIDRCICDEGGLRSAIAKNKSKNVCVGSSIELSTEIDISGTSFNIGCDQICTGATCTTCSIVGAGSNRILSGSPSNANFKNINFSKGSADNGGVASLTGGATGFVLCKLSDNKATANGGAIFVTGSSTTLLLDSVEFKTNSANNGGAVFTADSATLTIIGGTFLSNTATVEGGAVSVTKSNLDLSSTGFYKNTAVNGGALAFKNGKSGLKSSVFSGNTATGKGSDIWISDDEPPSATGSNVNCDAASKVEFCGTAGIAEFANGPLGTQLFDNTDCDTDGVVDPSSAAVCTKY